MSSFTISASVILFPAPLRLPLLRLCARPPFAVSQQLQTCHDPPPAPHRLDRNETGIDPGFLDRVAHHRHPGEHHIIADLEVTPDPDRPGDHAARADAG